MSVQSTEVHDESFTKDKPALLVGDDLINNHTWININSDSCISLIIMGGIYFEAVIYFPCFVVEIKQFCTSKTV